MAAFESTLQDGKKAPAAETLGMNGGTGTAASNAVTLNQGSGVITLEALTTAAGATYTLTLTNSYIAAADIVLVMVDLGAGTDGTPVVTSVEPAAGSVVIIIQNIHASDAFNAAIKIRFVVVKQA